MGFEIIPNMKTIYIIAILAIMGAACNDGSESGAATVRVNGKVVKRNTQINKSNAYNDLFLDSASVEKFITEQKLNDTVANLVRDFYNARNFEYAWFDSRGLNEQALAFRNLYDYNKDSATERKNLDYKLDRLAGKSDLVISASNADAEKSELMLTWRFINYTAEEYGDPRMTAVARDHFLPAMKMESIKMAETVANAKDRQGITNNMYNALKDELKTYMTYVEKGGWPELPLPKKKLKLGSKDTTIALIKKRFQVTGQLAANDTLAVFDAALDNAVKSAQATYGYKQDGVITADLVKDLNVPAEARLQQILINMFRMHWIPEEPEGKLIVVNIPEFTLHVKEAKSDAFNMPVVVGKEGTNTVLFAGTLNQIVFSPYWNLPESIIQNEIQPEIEKDPDYLAKHDMEVTGERDGVPVIRQKPGNQNQLGKIKFLFPNSYNIYFHDTPYKGLFEKDKRAYSHGCIRLGDPVKLAEYLLRDQPEWDYAKITDAMNSGKEKFVRVKDPVPVLIYYYTAWVNADGKLQFRGDIYDRDKRMAGKLFTDRQLFEFSQDRLAQRK
jgi:murein L,D-transpeptidase YcbB/YkuD